MNTAAVYYDDPYLKELDSTVIEVLDNALVLDRTIFYPEGGGQRGDCGFISTSRVTSTVHDSDGRILHLVDNPHAFSKGQNVHISLDWDQRYRLMKAHTAQHMISGILYHQERTGTVAIHLGDEFLTVETDSPSLSRDLLYRVEDSVNAAIASSRSVSSRILSHEEAERLNLRRQIKVSSDVRIVTIDGVDEIACGGLHVASTSEIGCVQYDSQEVLRGHVRTIWRYAEGARNQRRMEHEAVREAGALLSCPAEDIAKSVSSMIERENSLKSALREKDVLIASMMIDGGKKVFASPVETASYQKLCCEDRTFFAAYEGPRGLSWLMSADEDTFKAFKSRFPQLGAKGGGRAFCWQGSACCDMKTLLETAEEILA